MNQMLKKCKVCLQVRKLYHQKKMVFLKSIAVTLIFLRKNGYFKRTLQKLLCSFSTKKIILVKNNSQFQAAHLMRSSSRNSYQQILALISIYDLRLMNSLIKIRQVQLNSRIKLFYCRLTKIT